MECGLENTELTSRYLSLRCPAASKCACVWVWNSGEILHKDLVLGWPKGLLGFSIGCYKKNPATIWPTRYHFLALPAFRQVPAGTSTAFGTEQTLENHLLSEESGKKSTCTNNVFDKRCWLC